MIAIQLLIVFIIYRDTLTQYDTYIADNETYIAVSVENAFTQYYNLQNYDTLSIGKDELLPRETKDPLIKYVWNHVLENNANLWFNIESPDFNLTYGNVPQGAYNVRLIADRENVKTTGCYELNGQRQSEAETYSISETSCVNAGYLVWAIGGLNSDYKMPDDITDYEKSTYLINIFKSASLFSLGILLIIPFTIFIILRPVQRSAKQVETFSLSSNFKRLPLKQLPSELNSFADAVNEAFERVQNSYARERTFRAAMAHELRTPLTILNARIDLLEPSDSKTLLKNDVNTMVKLVDRLLQLAEMTAPEATKETLDFEDLLEEVIHDHKDFAEQNKQEIILEPLSAPVSISVNKDMFKLALSNIIINSIRHGSSSKGKTVQPIIITPFSNGSVTIRDFGKGFSKETLRSINITPDQGHNPYRGGRVGIGMMIIHAAIQSMDAAISFENEDGGGTTTRVSFPSGPHKS